MSLFPKLKRNLFVLILILSLGIGSVSANNETASLPFTQDWSSIGLIVTNDDWSLVPAIIGYRGDNLTAVNGVDPQTVLTGDDVAPVVDVIANATNPNTNTTGGVAEFESLANPTIALQGSATADAPYIKIFLNTTNMNNVRISYDLRDIDGSTDNAIQPVALQYRLGSGGNFTNLPAGFVADATTGPSLATLVTNVNVALPAAVNNQLWVELRIMTVNAVGNDEWVGIDNISITSNSAPTRVGLSLNTILENQPSGTLISTLTAADTNAGDTHTFTLVNSAACAGNGADNSNFSITDDKLFSAATFDYETKTSYQVCIQVTDNNGLSFVAEQTVNVQDIADETAPSVSVEQAVGQADPTNASPVNFIVQFTEPILGFDASKVSVVSSAGSPTVIVTEIAPNDHTVFNVAVSGMSMNGTITVSVPAKAAADASGNLNIASTGVDNVVTYSTDTNAPFVVFSSNTVPSNGSILLAGPKQITIEFSEDIKHDAGTGAANTVANYMLVEQGANGKFDTMDCFNGRVSDDLSVDINSAAYANSGGYFVATLDINNGIPLGAGTYRLFVCGTTSIEDLLGNELNSGLSDAQINFTVSRVLDPSSSEEASTYNKNTSKPDVILPVTGFPKGRVTYLPAQSADKQYASFSDLWLEIPSLSVSTPIVGVPLTKDGWDVTWLDDSAGWLNGTAFPTWSGNSVITGHVWDAYDQPGIFSDLKTLRYGDHIKIHAYGQVYIYEVRQTKRIAPENVSAALAHEDKAWLTLLTCEEYKFLFQTYQYRRMVRAVLISVVPEK